MDTDKVDPWSPVNSTDSELLESCTRVFEDNFVPKKSEKLPDSAEYLASLERKLARIRSGKGCKKTEGKELIKSLEENSDSCMYRLIAGDSYSLTEEDLLLEAPVGESLSAKWLRSQVNPEQALTVGELVELVKADYLAQSCGDTESLEKSDMPDQFWGRCSFCLVTGASQGIGRSFAVEFARRFAAGSRMVLVARSDDGLQQTKTLALANNPHVTVQVHLMDLSRPDPAAYKAILQDEEFRGESYDLAMLVHNAGSVGRVDLLAADIEDPQEWNRYMSLNLYHVTALTAEFLRRFTSGHRCIINVTSLCAVKPFKSMGYYCVGKAAREMYFKVLADENSDLDILNYSPGPVATEMVDNLITTVQDSATREQFEQMRDTNSLVTTELTTQKLVALLASRSYKSGDRFDYYDKL